MLSRFTGICIPASIDDFGKECLTKNQEPEQGEFDARSTSVSENRQKLSQVSSKTYKYHYYSNTCSSNYLRTVTGVFAERILRTV